MKTQSHVSPVPAHPTEEEIREKALELYIQSGWMPGRDLDNWLEAEALLTAQARAHAPSFHPEHPERVRAHHPGVARQPA